MSQSVGLALATEGIPFATAIAPIYAQSVDEFAQNAAYLHEVSGGRFQFGIGIAHAPAYVRMEAKPLVPNPSAARGPLRHSPGRGRQQSCQA
jgi:alkanesulfonate monooxygenase SsuD/methylene tetrahydromethanopterin reductase-like flavin-dependent oxidoreductase (luciferase family)